MIIRPVEAGDVRPLLDLTGTQIEGSWLNHFEISFIKANQFLWLTWNSPATHWAMLAEHNDQLIGGMTAVAGEHPFSCDVVAQDIFLVVEDVRATFALISAYEHWAKEIAGAHIASLGVTLRDTDRISKVSRLYNKLGYIPTGPSFHKLL